MIMMGDKPKGGGVVVIEKKSLDEGAAQDSAALVAISEELIASVKAGDSQGVADALKAAIMHCMMENSEEYGG